MVVKKVKPNYIKAKYKEDNLGEVKIRSQDQVTKESKRYTKKKTTSPPHTTSAKSNIQEFFQPGLLDTEIHFINYFENK